MHPEDFEFFENAHGIKTPDEIFDTIHFDPFAREVEEVEHPLKGRSYLSGCYLIYTFYDWGEERRLCPIYAGRAKTLSGRLCTHHNDDASRVSNFYENLVDSGKMKIIATSSNGKQIHVNPEEITRVAIWHEPNERERIFLEHGLIYIFRPEMNDD